MKWIVALCCIVLLSGCMAGGITGSIGKKIAIEDLENYRENIIKSKASIIRTCGCQSGLMQGLFGDRYAIDLPNSYQRAANEYDNLCRSFPNSPYEENFKLCKLIGLKVNMEYTGMKYAKEQFMEMLPGIMKFFQGF